MSGGQRHADKKRPGAPDGAPGLFLCKSGSWEEAFPPLAVGPSDRQLSGDWKRLEEPPESHGVERLPDGQRDSNQPNGLILFLGVLLRRQEEGEAGDVELLNPSKVHNQIPTIRELGGCPGTCHRKGTGVFPDPVLILLLVHHFLPFPS